MPRPTRANGRPGTEVIPADWAVSHRPTADKTMRGGTVALRHPGTSQGWSEEAEQNVEVPTAVYWTGQARIQELATRDQVTVTADDREVTLRYLVVVPAAVDPAVDDLMAVADADDSHLDGHTLVVAAVSAGTLRWERDLYCALTD